MRLLLPAMYGLLLLLSLALAWLRLRRQNLAPRSGPKMALTLWMVGYLLERLVTPAGAPGLASAGGLPAGLGGGVAGLLAATGGLAQWSGLAYLALYGHERRDRRLLLPFGLLLAVLLWSRQLPPHVVAALTLPAYLRMRWRDQTGRGTALFALAVMVPYLLLRLTVLDVGRIGLAPAAASLAPSLGAYLDRVHALGDVYAGATVLRVVFTSPLRIHHVRWRLLVSYLLTGLVPVVLLVAFWGLSTVLSTKSQLAQIATRSLQRRASELGAALDASLGLPSPEGITPAETTVPGASPAAGAGEGGASRLGGPSSRRLATADRAAVALQAWAEAEGAVLPSLCLWLRQGRGPWRRLAGTHLAGEDTLLTWPDSLASEGVVVVEGKAFLSARRSRFEGAAARRALVAVSLAPLLEEDVRAIVGSDAVLETGLEVVSSGEDGLEIRSLPSADARGGEGGAALASEAPARRGDGWRLVNMVGSALVPTLEWTPDAGWVRRQRVLWVRVPLGSALPGMIHDLRENPLNLIPLVLLGLVASLFLVMQLLTLGMVTSLGRSITRGIAALRRGASRLAKGELAYRIPVEGRDELWSLAHTFNEMAAGLERAHELEVESRRLEDELALARRIQERLLPSSPPQLPNLEVAGVSLPAREVGGDYYDCLVLPDGRVGLVVADVSGKGVPAALLMSSFRAALLAQDLATTTPGDVLTRLNRFVHRSVEPGRFITAFLALFAPDSGEVVYASAGHNPPFLLASDGRATRLRDGGLMLGVDESVVYGNARVQADEGDILVLYTDGVTEAENGDEELWGDAQLLEVLRAGRAEPCSVLLDTVLERVRHFAGGHAPSDDITLLLARRVARAGARSPAAAADGAAATASPGEPT